MKEILKNCVVAILIFEAKILLRRRKPKIIAITGSVGKTTTKDAVYTVLKNHVHTRKSEKSFNSEIGVPLTILGLQNGWNNPLYWFKNIIDGALHALFSNGYPEVLVLEMGVDRKGDMKRLTAWIKPDIVILTCLPDVPAHVEYFSSPQEIIDEKMVLVQALNPSGTFVYNNDDEKIKEYLQSVPQDKLSYGADATSDFQISQNTVIYDGASPIGIEFTLTHQMSTDKISILGSLGVQHAHTYGAALAVGKLFSIETTQSIKDLESHVQPAGRMRVFRGITSTTIIDDTYNASPVAVLHALTTLCALKTKGRKIAVLGDMLELGQFSVVEHERVGALVSKNADVLFTLGVRAQKIAQSAFSSGMQAKNIFAFDDMASLIATLTQFLENNDIVLVKASQGVRAEKVVKAIMAEPQKAEQLLVRQDVAWGTR